MGRWHHNFSTGEDEYKQDALEKGASALVDGLGNLVMAPFSFLGNLGENLGLLMLGFAGVLAIGLVLLCGGYLVSLETGIIKSTMDVSLTIPQNSPIVSEEVTLYSVCANNNKVKKVPFAADGIAQLKTKKGIYSMYTSWDGMMSGFALYNIGTLAQSEAAAEPILIRALILQFCDEKGNLLTPEAMQITDGDGKKLDCFRVNNNDYILHLPEKAQSLQITIAVDGYMPLTLSEDWNANRLGKLEVELAYEK